MKSQSRSHGIGLVFVPALMVALSACLPPSTDGLRPDNAVTSDIVPVGPAQPNSPSEPTAAAPAGPAGPGAPQAGAPVITWVPIGPVGPNDPTSGQRYLLLQQLQCEALEQSVKGADDSAVWLAGAAVCRALLSGSRQDWEVASSAVASTPRIPQTQCLESRVALSAAAAVAQYRSAPEATFRVEPGQGEACPRQLTGLTVVDEQLKPVGAGDRASGPRTGGTIVRLDGYYVRVGEVLIDGAPADVDFVGDRKDYGTVYLRMPPANGRDSLRLSITDTVDVTGTVAFFYDDAPPLPAPTGSDQPGSTPAGTSPAGTPSATPSTGTAPTGGSTTPATP
ncbi:hypothetical protein [Paenarthrobacter ilicis]|uniref:hypothetical protein n=1 Tax=Paenarthrobacter ilicis TaxID=43665 RepID=UPI00386E8145